MSTTAQRDLIRRLLREVEFDLARITLMHTRIPHCTRAQVGDQVDFWIDGLSVAQASEVVGWLQEQVS